MSPRGTRGGDHGYREHENAEHHELPKHPGTVSGLARMPPCDVCSTEHTQLAYWPRVDGDFIKENPQDSIAMGAYARVSARSAEDSWLP